MPEPSAGFASTYTTVEEKVQYTTVEEKENNSFTHIYLFMTLILMLLTLSSLQNTHKHTTLGGGQRGGDISISTYINI